MRPTSAPFRSARCFADTIGDVDTEKCVLCYPIGISCLYRLSELGRDREAKPDGASSPLPVLTDAMEEATPMTAPLASNTGPPELPGLTAASIWMALSDDACRILELGAPTHRLNRAIQSRDDACGHG